MTFEKACEYLREGNFWWMNQCCSTEDRQKLVEHVVQSNDVECLRETIRKMNIGDDLPDKFTRLRQWCVFLALRADDLLQLTNSPDMKLYLSNSNYLNDIISYPPRKVYWSSIQRQISKI